MRMSRNDRKECFGFITVRTASSRLPKKCLLEFGEGTVLDHVIRRARFFGITPVVCTTDSAHDDPIEEIAVTNLCRCFRGSEKDKLARWLGACEAFGVERFHTVDADDPFFDGDLARDSMDLLLEGSYDAVYPSEETYLASVGYSLSADIVRRACDVKTSDDTEMMWSYLESVPGFRRTALRVPDGKGRDVRLTLDYEEDYWLLRTVLRILGPECRRRDIEELFTANPHLRLVNWFRNEEWKHLQMIRAARHAG